MNRWLDVDRGIKRGQSVFITDQVSMQFCMPVISPKSRTILGTGERENFHFCCPVTRRAPGAAGDLV